MITLNLLPSGRRANVFPTWWKQLPWKKLATVAGVLLAVWSAWVLVAAQSQARSLARVRAEWEGLGPEQIKLERIRKDLDALQKRVSILKWLQAPEGQWAPRLNFLSDGVVSDLWFTLFNFSTTPKGDLEEFLRAEGMPMPDLSLPPGVQTPSDQSGEPAAPLAGWKPFIMLAGSALVSGKGAEGPPVTRFLERLKDHPEFGRWFSGVELKGIRHRQVKSEEVSDFVIFLYPTGL